MTLNGLQMAAIMTICGVFLSYHGVASSAVTVLKNEALTRIRRDSAQDQDSTGRLLTRHVRDLHLGTPSSRSCIVNVCIEQDVPGNCIQFGDSKQGLPACSAGQYLDIHNEDCMRRH